MPGHPPVTGTVTTVTDGVEMVCLGTNPLDAWTLSVAVARVPGRWDLWQVHLRSTDAVHVQPCWGDRVQEIRVPGTIEPTHVLWIAQAWFPGRLRRALRSLR